jgi:magnesium and cobalt exporter, CNNM family
MGTDVLVILFLVALNGFFVLSETALVYARKSRLEDWANQGDKKARVALEIANKPNQLLAAVQFGITCTTIVVGVFSGRAVADRFAASIDFVLGASAYGHTFVVGLVIAGVTCLLLVIGELLPKRLVLRSPEKIATIVAKPIRVFTMIVYPLVHLLNLCTDSVFRLFGSHQAEPPPVTEEEIKTLVQQGTEAGVFEESEQNMVEAVFSLGDRTARSLMTPRSQIVWLALTASDDEIRAKISASGYSRFPVSTDSLDHVAGVVQVKDLLTRHFGGNAIDLKPLLQEPLFVPRTVSALHALDLFKQSGKHIALVVDEYGGIEGLLTHHDILEAIAGDMTFGGNAPEAKAVQRHDGSWLLDGMLAVDEFKEIFHIIDILPGEKKDAYQTLGGFIFTQMGRVPAVAESFEWGNLRFEIVDMDGKRIDKVLVMPAEKTSRETRVTKSN